MSSKNSLVITTGEIFKKGINDMETKPNVAREAITPSIVKNNIDTVKKIEKPQPSKINKKINPSAINQKKLNHLINKGLLKELK